MILPTDQHELDLVELLLTDHLFSFGPIRYTGETSQEHELEPLGLKCVMPGIAQTHLSGIFKVLKSQTQRRAVGHSILICQSEAPSLYISWVSVETGHVTHENTTHELYLCFGVSRLATTLHYTELCTR